MGEHVKGYPQCCEKTTNLRDFGVKTTVNVNFGSQLKY